LFVSSKGLARNCVSVILSCRRILWLEARKCALCVQCGVSAVCRVEGVVRSVVCNDVFYVILPTLWLEARKSTSEVILRV
jgi:hypothetical protein